MEKVDLWQEMLWSWKCPNCKTDNELYEDDEEIVYCEQCGNAFEPEYQQ